MNQVLCGLKENSAVDYGTGVADLKPQQELTALHCMFLYRIAGFRI